VATPLSAKLARRFYGPFKILERNGPVAYRLELPATVRIHNVFHVSLLKPFLTDGSPINPAPLPPAFLYDRPISRPVQATAVREVLIEGKPRSEWLVEWDDGGLTPSTWEPVDQLQQSFPDLRLADKPILIGGENDTVQPDNTRPVRERRRPRRYED